ncbi:hypothetical protein I598_3172 [Isoptericola dokdonensis DS-3]|jgi:hypothetical protein|uniref:Uncharacterized protein n=1 Tax=Isoptericola dokdonensis DS-3 TaxID=1300344 RepID=A0A161IKH2_9MICO|nr:hypothetical protein I598_3172 [Isoptericola dokdonensis DS-3]
MPERFARHHAGARATARAWRRPEAALRQYQPTDIEWFHAAHGVPYRPAM